MAIAVRSFRKRPLRTALLVLEVALGVAAVFLVLNSLLSTLAAVKAADERGQQVFYAFSGTVTRDDEGRIRGRSSSNWFQLEDVAALREQATFLQRVSPIRETHGTRLEVGGNRYLLPGGYGVGADYAEIMRIAVSAGTFFTRADEEQGSPVCVISQRLARQLFGDTSPLGKEFKIGPDFEPPPPPPGVPEAKVPRGPAARSFRIIGVFESPDRLSGLLSGPVIGPPPDLLMPVRAADFGFGDPGGFSHIVVEARPGQASPARREVEEILKQRHAGASPRFPGASPFEVTIEESGSEAGAGAFLEFFNRSTAFFGAMGLVALAVSGIGILSAMLVAVLERTREVGLRRAMGASRRAVLLQFLAEAAFVGLAGGLAGLALGVALDGLGILSRGFLFFPGTFSGFRFNLTAAAAAIGSGLLTGLFAGLYPAWQAANLPPAEALREG